MATNYSNVSIYSIPLFSASDIRDRPYSFNRKLVPLKKYRAMRLRSRNPFKLNPVHVRPRVFRDKFNNYHAMLHWTIGSSLPISASVSELEARCVCRLARMRLTKALFRTMRAALYYASAQPVKKNASAAAAADGIANRGGAGNRTHSLGLLEAITLQYI